MNAQQIQQIINDRAFPDVPDGVQLMETHISWVILTKNFAFKIKKPLKYPFLDFLTLGKRNYYCHREIELNRRLTQDMYLKVLPIRIYKGKASIGGEKGKVLDFAVMMKRIDISRQMNVLLEAGCVNDLDMKRIAGQLTDFHKQAEVVKKELDLDAMQEDFADILSVRPFIDRKLGKTATEILEDSVSFSKHFLKTHATRLVERHQKGFVIDGHGDLHSKNIFLPEGGSAIIFDCIEFSDHFRQVDILNELAFFCMDLDFYNRSDLGASFLKYYKQEYPIFIRKEDWAIFRYFKLYRANVRVKINALKSEQEDDHREVKKRSGMVDAYFKLFERYLTCFVEKV